MLGVQPVIPRCFNCTSSLSLLLAQLARQSTRCLTMSAPKKAATLETLHFDNQALERLPVDKETKNYVRTVRLFWSSVC